MPNLQIVNVTYFTFEPISLILGNVYTLVHGELTHSLLGRYTCQASNNKGTSTSSCVITEGGYDDLDEYPTATVSSKMPSGV